MSQLSLPHVRKNYAEDRQQSITEIARERERERCRKMALPDRHAGGKNTTRQLNRTASGAAVAACCRPVSAACVELRRGRHR